MDLGVLETVREAHALVECYCENEEVETLVECPVGRRPEVVGWCHSAVPLPVIKWKQVNIHT